MKFSRAGAPFRAANDDEDIASSTVVAELGIIRQDIGSLKQDVSSLKADVRLLKWMIGFALAGIAALVIRGFF